MSAANPFVEILNQFRSAWAKYAEIPFPVSAMTKDELQEETGVLGFVATADGDIGAKPGYYLAASLIRSLNEPYHDDDDARPERRENHPFDTFRRLAAKAGTALPLAEIKKMPAAPGGTPVDRWLSFMWWRNPPTEDQLTRLAGDNRARNIWAFPFSSAIEAIESSGLLGISGEEATPNSVPPTPAKVEEKAITMDPGEKDGVSSCHMKAAAAYDWALSNISGVEDMTINELHDAIMNHPSDACETIPEKAETFGRYLRRMHLARNRPQSRPTGGRSVERRSAM